MVVLAPASEQSCSGMRLTLRHDLKFQERSDISDSLRIEDGPPLRIFSLDGSPCDCAIVAMDGGLQVWAPEIAPASLFARPAVRRRATVPRIAARGAAPKSKARESTVNQ